MVLCNIIHDKLTDARDEEALKKYIESPLFNVCKKPSQILDGLPVILYGRKLATDAGYKIVGMDPNCLDKNGYATNWPILWTYAASELYEQMMLHDLAKSIIDRHFFYLDLSVDVVFHDWDYPSWLHKIYPWPLVHAGKYELYVAEKDDYNNISIHSFKYDNLQYAGIDPETMFYDIIRDLGSKCVVFSTAEIDLTKLNTIPISYQDLAQAHDGEIPTFSSIIKLYAPFRQLSKHDVLMHILRAKYFNKQKLSSFI